MNYLTLSVLSSGDDAADSKSVALKLIQRFSTQKGWDLLLSSFHLSGNGQSSQCSAEYIQRGDQPPDYWAVTVFAKDGRAVLMSYTATVFDEPKERAERQKIFEDFRWE